MPEDVSVLGFDDIMPAAFSTPPLSTIQLPADRLGGAALSLLEQRLVAADPTRPAHRLELGCRLVLRQYRPAAQIGRFPPPPRRSMFST